MQVDLRQLDLSFNNLQALEAAHLKPLTQLSSLSLYANRLQTLADLPPLPALRHLSIGAHLPIALRVSPWRILACSAAVLGASKQHLSADVWYHRDTEHSSCVYLCYHATAHANVD